ncbi:MAG: hypothetical protein SFW67_09780 [Myxococcaceae bacterium]|nr:hypothetical protein [Myxococcaceae bacterium]
MQKVQALVLVIALGACSSSRVIRSSPPAAPPAPRCNVVTPATKVTDVTCQGPFSREQLWSAALRQAAETGPEHGALSFSVVETNESQGWRALRAKFPAAGEASGPYSVELLVPPAQLETLRLRATTRSCQLAVITDGTDPQVKATCLQFLSTQQQLVQSERHHAEQLAVQRAQAEAQREQAAAMQRAVESRKPECRMGTDGVNECGYNCRMGTNGRMYCASVPNGECAFNSNGTYTCP